MPGGAVPFAGCSVALLATLRNRCRCTEDDGEVGLPELLLSCGATSTQRVPDALFSNGPSGEARGDSVRLLLREDRERPWTK